MPENIQERVERALSQLVEEVVPVYPEDDEAAVQERLDDAYDFAIVAVQDAGETPLSSDVNHAHDLIKRKLIRDNAGPEPALRFTNLYSRLLTLPVLNNKWALLYFLHIVADESRTDKLLEADPSALNRRSGLQATIEPSEISSPHEKAGRRDFAVDSPAFNEAFSNAGLLRLPLSEDQRPPRQGSSSRAERSKPERPKQQPALK